MALEIKYSDKLGGSTLDAKRAAKVKCSWSAFEILTIDNDTISFKKILLSVVTDTPNTRNQKILDAFGIDNEFDVGYGIYTMRNIHETIGIPTGNYIDYDGDRYIELATTPNSELMKICKSKEWLKNCYTQIHLSAENKYRQYLPYIDIITNMYYGRGYDKSKYILTYTVPEKAWVKLKSVTLYNLDDTVFDKGDIEKDSSTTIKENKESNAWWLALGLFALKNL